MKVKFMCKAIEQQSIRQGVSISAMKMWIEEARASNENLLRDYDEIPNHCHDRMEECKDQIVRNCHAIVGMKRALKKAEIKRA